MSETAWVVLTTVILILVVIVLLAVARAASARRRSHLQQRFGPEYDRTVETAGSRRRAEHDLADRERQRDEIEVRPLSEAARSRFSDEWQDIQQRFVDDPEGAATRAQSLVHRVMEERGYPTDDSDTAAGVVSVDYPDVVHRYRQGCKTLRTDAAGSDEHTENLRTAMVDFRSVLETLLETGRDRTPGARAAS